MRTSGKSVLALCSFVMGLGMTGQAFAASGVGPYYAMPSWDQTLPGATRFVVLTNMNSEAVLDRETGLVWEQGPTLPGFGSGPTWLEASIHCVRLKKGGRWGWRLPTVQDLASLIDPTQSNPALASGHPFTVRSSDFWSATSNAGTTAVWLVGFNTGGVGRAGKDDSSGTTFAWCVRGGQGVDPQ